MKDVGHPNVQRRAWFAGWNRFWFTPADPTLLGLIRICCGLITLYTLIVYSFSLQDFMGEYAWQDLKTRLKQAYDEPRVVTRIVGPDGKELALPPLPPPSRASSLSRLFWLLLFSPPPPE